MTNEEVDKIALFVKDVLSKESYDLLEISSAYREVMKTGMFNGRKHPKDLAQNYAKEFAIRSDALDIMANYIYNDIINKFKSDEKI